MRLDATATRPPSALTPMGTTTPRQGVGPPPTLGMISLREPGTTARRPSSHSGNDFQAFPRVISTATLRVESHKRTKANSRRSDPISTSASPAAMSGGSLPAQAAWRLEMATRSLSAVRSRTSSASDSMGILLATLSSCGPAPAPAARGETGQGERRRDFRAAAHR